MPSLNRPSFKLLAIVYFILINLNYIVFWSRNNPYVRPQIFFVILAISGVVVFFQVLNTKNSLQKLIVFGEILLLSITFTLTQQLLYQSPLSRDPWTHWALVSQILHNGHIPPYESIKTPYVYLPNFHLEILTYMLIGKVPYKWASYLVVGIPTLMLLSVVIYLFSTNLVSEKVEIPLLALLFLVTADNVLDMVGKNIVPNSLGVALALLIFYFIWRHGPNYQKVTVPTSIMIIGLAFMHTLSYGMLILQLFILLFLLIIIQDKNQSLLIGKQILILFIIAMFVWGLWSHVYFRSLVMLFESLLKGIEPEKYTAKLSIPLKYVILARLGVIVYFAIAGLGSIYVIFGQIRKKSLQNGIMLIVLTVLFSGAIGVFAFLNPGWSGIAHRYWYYGEIVGSITIGSMLFYLSEKHEYKGVLSSIMVFILILLMFGASVSNDDNPLIKEYSTRTGWYDSEITAGLFTIAKIQEPVASDWDYLMNLNNLKWTKQRYSENPPKYGDIGWIIKSKFPKNFFEIFKGKGYVFIFRENTLQKYSFWLGPRWGMVQYTPLKNNTSQIIQTGNYFKSVIYSSDSTLVWYS